ncbi:hypothetical protein CT157_23295 [Pseudomonas syringae]|uniref:Uncharacterized protein n=1 Tax=Pseudomonas syringae TaxID=317 RepID=A0A3T0JZF6_PSESX|nr:hypothetical protein CT157_23295 [Pseudomonas syringae]
MRGKLPSRLVDFKQLLSWFQGSLVVMGLQYLMMLGIFLDIARLFTATMAGNLYLAVPEAEHMSR